MPNLIYLDIETTGLDPDLHDVWEIGLITDTGAEYCWQICPDMTHADPKALEVGGYYQRHFSITGQYPFVPTTTGIVVDTTQTTSSENVTPDTIESLSRYLARLLAGTVVVGNNPAFDKDFLSRLLRRNNQVWTAHHRPWDGIAMAAGASRRSPGSSSTDIFRAWGINPGAYDRHTALGDARMIRDLVKALNQDPASALCPHDVEFDMCDTPACTHHLNTLTKEK